MKNTMSAVTIEEQFKQAADAAKKDRTEQQDIEAVDAVLAAVEKAKKLGEISPNLLRELYAALAELRDETARVLKTSEAAKVLRPAFSKPMLVREVEKIILERRRVLAKKNSKERAAKREAEINTTGIRVIKFENGKTLTEYNRNFPWTREELKRFGLGDPKAPRWLGTETRVTLDQAIAFLNSKLAYVMDPGVIVSMFKDFVAPQFWKQSEAAFFLMKPHDFTGHHYSDYYYFDSSSLIPTVKQLAPKWQASPDRRIYDIMTYRPGKPLVITGTSLNRWMGWACDSKEGDVSLWHWLMEFMFPNPEERLFVERWIAYPIKYPGTKMFTALVLISDTQGVGKSLAGEILSRIYGTNAIFIGKNNLASDFNEWQAEKQLIIAEEITAGKSRDGAEKIKQLVTQESVLVNRKNQPLYRLPDVSNWLFLSNHPDALFMSSQDRRFVVFDIERTEAETIAVKAKHDEVAEWGKRSPEGPAALRFYFEHLDMGDFKPTDRAPQTEAKRSMVDIGKTMLERWVDEQTDLGTDAGWLGGREQYQVLWELNELLKYWDPEKNKREGGSALIKVLKAAGYERADHGEKITTKLGRPRLWIMVPKPNAFLEMRPEEIGRLYNKERGLDNLSTDNTETTIPF